MREMGIQAIYPRQNTSKANPENKVYPYLLRGLNIDHPDHVWSMDIAYILMLTRLHEIPESGSTDLWPTITASGHTQVSSTTHRKRYVGAGSNSSASLPCRMVSGDRYMRCQGFLRKLQAADPWHPIYPHLVGNQGRKGESIPSGIQLKNKKNLSWQRSSL